MLPLFGHGITLATSSTLYGFEAAELGMAPGSVQPHFRHLRLQSNLTHSALQLQQNE